MLIYPIISLGVISRVTQPFNMLIDGDKYVTAGLYFDEI